VLLNRALRESEDRYAVSVAGTQDGLWDWNILTGEDYLSPRWKEILGYEDYEIDNVLESFTDALHPDDRVRAMAAVTAHLEDRAPYDLECRLRRKEGDYVWVRARGQAKWDEDGTPVRMAGSISDLTEHKKAEEALIAAKEEAERANNAKSEFLSSMSHELRTPLNAVIGFTQLLRTDPDHPLSPRQEESAELVLKSGEHLLSLIEDVLDLAKIETGNLSLDLTPQDPAESLNSCRGIAGNLAAQKGLTFVDRTKGFSMPRINIDRTRFQQALLNLLSNAVKYNRDGGTVTLSVEESGNGVLRFSVADTGIGIPKEKQDRVFKEFSRLGHENSDIAGTGIGLTITRDIVEAMGGAIGFESDPGRGSKFWIDFPIIEGALAATDQDVPAAGAKTKPRKTAATPYTEKTQTILCVEDNPSSLMLLESIIGRIPGTAMISAHTGELGVDLAEIHVPDVILMDINLPGIDGMEALKRLKTSSATRNIPVIALTARARTSDRGEGMEAGFLEYITKPFNVEEVTSSLVQVLQRA